MDILCPNCLKVMHLARHKTPPRFCIFCGKDLKPATKFSDTTLGHTSEVTSAVTLVPGHLPHKEQIQFSIGPYQIISHIGKGGMGEVFLAYDTSCGRRIALKRIRPDLVSHQQMHNRFLKEARVTSQLTHPAIIAIYEIHDERHLAYYTMPYVEGDTLKQLLKNARSKEKLGEKLDQTLSSIPALIRIFLSVCQAVAYAHSKGVLHRDLKPENIIVGRYGEAMILDWGLAKLTDSDSEKTPDEPIENLVPSPLPNLRSLTHMGKVVGTISYMAPERALGNPATYQTDIYSLGVILYQILTLRHPFHRKSLKEFRKNLHNEQLYEPSIIAPHRDVPDILAQIAMRCLEKDPQQRYKTVDELLYHLEGYIEGRPEWFLSASLTIHNPSDWEFQENVLIAEHMAITRGPEISNWVNLMISKESFDANTQIEAEVCLGENSQGLGFLVSVPEAAERVHLNDGYTIWLGSDLQPSAKLMRSTVEVLHFPEVFLQRNINYNIRIQKVDNHIYLYINNVLQFSYLELLPMVGTHIGLLSRDGNFSITSLKVSVGGHNITVNCLAVPDSFLAHKDYATALSEYRRIGNSFPGRAEGREALFRAGITLLEQAKASINPTQKANNYELTFTEFEKLHNSAGAPLEYLGKALVYQSLGDFDEEIKCFELALRRYPRHPLLGSLKEQIIHRMHECSRAERRATYQFVLLVVCQMPEALATPSVKQLCTSLNRHWEKLYFIDESPVDSTQEAVRNSAFATQLAFWLNKPYSLKEVIDSLLTHSSLAFPALINAFFALYILKAWENASAALELLSHSEKLLPEHALDVQMLQIAYVAHEELETSIDAAIALATKLTPNACARLYIYLCDLALDQKLPTLVNKLIRSLPEVAFTSHDSILLKCAAIWAALQTHNWTLAGDLLHEYPLEILTDEGTPLHFLYGCWLYVTEGPDIAALHFSSTLDYSTPRAFTLFSHYYNGKISLDHGWMTKAFDWEKLQLYRQMSLFYTCNGEANKAEHFRQLAQQLFI